MSMLLPLSIFMALVSRTTLAFVPLLNPSHTAHHKSSFLLMTIVSPFDESSDDAAVATRTDEASTIGDGPFELTWENVEMVLDQMRP
jgi:hypothetical protein